MPPARCLTGSVTPRWSFSASFEPVSAAGGHARFMATAVTSAYFRPAPVLNKTTLCSGESHPLASR